MKLKICLDKGIAFMPTRAHEDDAGLDIYCTADTSIPAHDRVTIETGVHVAIPKGYVGLLTSKSGLMRREGLTCRGTIDSGYTGSIQAVVFNDSDNDVSIGRGEKLTQLVIVPCLTPELEVADALDETDRGSNGFGSSGR